MATIDEQLGQMVHDRRVELGLSQHQFCEATGGAIYQSAVSALEKGHRRWTMDVAAGAARALGFDFVLPLQEPGEAPAPVDVPPPAPQDRVDGLSEEERQLVLAWRLSRAPGVLMALSTMLHLSK